MIKGPKLTRSQWEFVAKAVSNISQAIILFSLAAFFVPEAVGLDKQFSRLFAFIFFVFGLLFFIGAVKLIAKGK